MPDDPDVTTNEDERPVDDADRGTRPVDDDERDVDADGDDELVPDEPEDDTPGLPPAGGDPMEGPAPSACCVDRCQTPFDTG